MGWECGMTIKFNGIKLTCLGIMVGISTSGDIGSAALLDYLLLDRYDDRQNCGE